VRMGHLRRGASQFATGIRDRNFVGGRCRQTAKVN
jgi:hypothetical protein